MSDEKSFQYAKTMFPLFRAIVKLYCFESIPNKMELHWPYVQIGGERGNASKGSTIKSESTAH